MVQDTVLAVKYGQTERGMKGNGNLIKLMERVNFGMQMVMFMKANGRMIKQMDTEFIFMSMVQDTKAIGKMIFRMVKVLNHGVMDLNLKVDTKKA